MFPPLILGDDVIVEVPDNQDEFSIAANPLDPDNLVVGANDYSHPTFVVGPGVFVSFDGGATWRHGFIPIPGPYTSGYDPAVAFGPDGTAYYAGIAADPLTREGGVFVSTSNDGGRTWATTVPFTNPPLPDTTDHDKPYVATDPGTGAIYLTFMFRAHGGVQRTAFTKSTDGGATWSAPLILGPGQFSLPAAGADGEIYVTWRDWPVQDRVWFAASSDGGASFTVSSPLDLGLEEIPVPFRAWPYPVMAVAHSGPHRGRVYLGGPQGVTEVQGPQQALALATDLVVLHSDDGGATWSEPDRIVRPGVQLMPWMAVQPDGTLGLAYMDTVLAPWSYVPSRSLPAPTPLVQSLSVKRPGELLWSTTVLTDEPSLAWASDFWGDYQGLAATGKGFHPAFADARGANAAVPCFCTFEAPLDFATMRVSV